MGSGGRRRRRRSSRLSTGFNGEGGGSGRSGFLEGGERRQSWMMGRWRVDNGPRGVFASFGPLLDILGPKRLYGVKLLGV